MTGPQVVNLHRAEGEKGLNDKGLTGVVISALVHDQSKVVDLQDQAEVNHRTHLATDHHGSFGKVQAASD